ncbi:hypothetical protein AAF712_001707 [Marasmius tenuissimus]|uniref:Uncharacterized protein n=1 Tax=Marasmius tenuissimus TaxID=585030 RepID=A0ABR3AAZ9_9AGAR
MFPFSIPSIPSISNTTFSAIFYAAIPAFLFLYLARSLPRTSKIYLSIGYYAAVLGHFFASKYAYYILKWVFIQLLRGCKALAWFGFYVNFFVAGMNFVIQGFGSVLEFLDGLGKVMEEAREEREREAEEEKRKERARASAPDSPTQTEEEPPKPKDSKKSRRKK